MKNKRLKNYLKLGILLFGMLPIFQNCQKEDSIENEFKNQTDYYKTVSLNQLPKLKPVIENLKTFNKSNTNISARQGTTYLGVENVLVDEIIQITNEDNISNYTFGIDTDFENTGFIENLYLREIEQGYISYIIRYEPNMNWYNNNLYSFHGKDFLNMENYQGDITKYSLEGEVIWSTKQEYIDNSTSSRSAGEFVTVCFISIAPVCGCNTAGHEHDPIGEGCNCVEYVTTEVCQSGWVGGGGSINDDGNDGSDPTSGGGTGDNNNDDCETSGTLVVDEQPISGIGTGCSNNEETGVNPPKKQIPCTKITEQINNTDFTEKVEILKDSLNLKYEIGYSQKTDGSFTKLENLSDSSLSIPITSDMKGFIHTHNNNYEIPDENGDGVPEIKKSYKIFSDTDVLTFIDLLLNANENNILLNDVYGSVYTSTGNYTLRFTGNIDNVQNNFQTQAQKEALRKKYKEYLKQYGNKEKAFLKFYKNEIGIEGVRLFKINNNGTIKEKFLDENGDFDSETCE